jgi:hypothetical protein
MDDAAGRIYRYGDEFEQSTALVRSDHQEALLALVLVLDETDRKILGVRDVGVGDAVLVRAVEDVNTSRLA